MIGSQEAEVLHECIRQAGPDTSIHQYSEDDLRENIDRLGYTADNLLNGLLRLFTVSGTRTRVSDRVDAGGGMSEQEQEVTLYKFDTERLLRNWAETIREQEVFDSFELYQEGEEEVSYAEATSEQDSIRFDIFFDYESLEDYSFEPNNLEFPVAFLDASHIDRDYAFTWYETIQEGFAARFGRKIARIRYAISSGFYEYEMLEQTRPQVRTCIRGYLEESGFSVSGEVSERCPELIKYNVDIARTDLVGEKNDSKLVICHCDMNDRWHGHHVVDGELQSVEPVAEFEDMSSKLQDLITDYTRIQQNKKSVSNWITAIAAFFPVATIVLSAIQFSSIEQLFSGISFFGISSAIVWLILFSLYTGAVMVLVYAITKPFYDDYRFRWKIEPYTESEDSRNNEPDEERDAETAEEERTVA